jgi:hypothetical protein
MMAAHSIVPPAEALYEQDFIAWTELMAERLEKHDATALDWDHLAEEIRDLGLSFKHALKSHLKNLQKHLIKWELQPARRSRSWEDSISNSRGEIASLLDSIPSLHGYLREKFDGTYDKAYSEAMHEMRFTKKAPYTRWSLEQVLDPGFLPE